MSFDEKDERFIREFRKLIEEGAVRPIEALRLYCAFCGRPLTLEYRRHAPSPIVAQPFACPYPDCDTVNYAGLAGELLAVWQGHGDEPEQT
jgi:hypothetical protein